MATFATLKASVSGILGLDTTAAGADDVELGKKLNDAVRDFLVRTHCYVTSQNITVDAAFETLPTDILAIQDLYLSAGPFRIERRTPQEIYDLRLASTSTAAAPAYYALNGADRMEFYPTPAAAVTLVVLYVPKPTEMTTTNDPSTATYGGIPVEYHPALEEYAKWKMADYDDDSSSQNGLLYQQEYMRLVRDAKRHMRERGGRTLGHVSLGRRSLAITSRSQDI